jgi:hypothetical protein
VINSLLPNQRWLSVPSENLGQDWYEKSLFLDQKLEGLGMDLAEESVYLLFSGTPDEVLEGNAQCLVARSVIGPKRDVTAPISLVDWKAAPVWRETIVGEGLVDLLEGAQELYFKAKAGAKPLAKDFALCVKRELTPELRVRIDVIFHE